MYLNNVILIIGLIIGSISSTYCYCTATKIRFSFESVDSSSKSFLLEFYDIEGNKSFSSSNLVDSFYYDFTIENPRIFYLFANKYFNRVNSIVVNDTLLDIKIINLNPLRLRFVSSPINQLFQQFLQEEDEINQFKDSISNYIKKNSSTISKTIKDSLIGIYFKEKNISEQKILQHEDKFIQSNKSSFLSLFILYKSIEGFKRSDKDA